jgi:hypothetical protein
MLKTFNCESLQPFDAVFLQDDPLNRSNIVGALYTEPFEFERMKSYFIAKTENIHKCRSKVVKKFGQFWFQKMSEEEWETKKDKVFVLKTGIHTDEELAEYMSKEQQIRDPYDNL